MAKKGQTVEDLEEDIQVEQVTAAEADELVQAAAGTVDDGRGAENSGESADGLTKELAEARQEIAALNDKLLRMAAEFENYKKRMDRERGIALKYAEENILKELLPTIDNFERAIEQGGKADNVGVLLEGLEMTRKGLLGSLEKIGLKPLDGVGEPFDPNFHEALAMEANSEIPENHILQEYERGYLYKDRLLRAAKVVVSKGAKQE